MTNQLTSLTKEALENINNEVYTGLLDAGLDPDEAWEAAFEADFSLAEEVEYDELVDIS